MTYDDFQKKFCLSRHEICRKTFEENRKNIKIKKEDTAVKNLDSIYTATLKIANKKGFQAMTMRDLSHATGMSMGSLYTYFASKEDLLKTLQEQHRSYFANVMEERIASKDSHKERLRTAIKTHLYLSEAMQPWFYFSYMEAKNLSRAEKEKAVESELTTERMIKDILIQGQTDGVFNNHDPKIGSGIIKAMLQDWYLKRSKHAKREITVDQYVSYLQNFIEAFYLKAVNEA